ncbi:MAG: hypothetical protein WCN85_01355 [Burkholderiales bacterium]
MTQAIAKQIELIAIEKIHRHPVCEHRVERRVQLYLITRRNRSPGMRERRVRKFQDPSSIGIITRLEENRPSQQHTRQRPNCGQHDPSNQRLLSLSVTDFKRLSGQGSQVPRRKPFDQFIESLQDLWIEMSCSHFSDSLQYQPVALRQRRQAGRQARLQKWRRPLQSAFRQIFDPPRHEAFQRTTRGGQRRHQALENDQTKQHR